MNDIYHEWGTEADTEMRTKWIEKYKTPSKKASSQLLFNIHVRDSVVICDGFIIIRSIISFYRFTLIAKVKKKNNYEIFCVVSFFPVLWEFHLTIAKEETTISISFLCKRHLLLDALSSAQLMLQKSEFHIRKQQIQQDGHRCTTVKHFVELWARIFLNERKFCRISQPLRKKNEDKEKSREIWCWRTEAQSLLLFAKSREKEKCCNQKST